MRKYTYRMILWIMIDLCASIQVVIFFQLNAWDSEQLFGNFQIDLVSAQDGKCVAEMTVSEEHTNTNGTLHGGLTSTIVDVISGIALVTHKNASVGVSVDLHIT